MPRSAIGAREARAALLFSHWGRGRSLGQHRSKGSPSSCLAKLPHPRQPLLPLLIENEGIVPVFVVVCALLVITLVGGQALMSMREQQKSLLDTLNDQVDIIKSCDESLLLFDELVIEQCDAKRLSPSATGDAAPSAEALNEGYRAVVAEIAPMRAQLEDSIASMETLQSSLSDNDDKEAASQVVTAARSRLNMLDAGVSIIEESMMATEAFLKADRGGMP